MKKEQVDELKRIANGEQKITSIKLKGDPWWDDYIECATAIVNGIKVDLWWMGSEGYAALKYAHDSKSAMEDFLDMLKGQLESELITDHDEEQTDSEAKEERQ